MAFIYHVRCSDKLFFPKPRCATQRERKGPGEDEMSQGGRGAERDSARRIHQGMLLATTGRRNV